jgi:HD-GYP domain-containing protein (c-di-GMP phosphodiesterase class II)
MLVPRVAVEVRPPVADYNRMRLVPTADFSEGVTLAMDLPTRPGHDHLPRAGAALEEEDRAELLESGIQRIYVEDELSRGIEVPLALSDATREAARAAVGRAVTEARFMPGDLIAYERLQELRAAAAGIVAEVERLPDAPYAFADLASADAYRIEHSIDATVVGLLVGRRLGLEGEPLHQLGLGLFLQDIGTLALPPSILHKPGPLADDELELMRRHPVRGLDFLRGEEIGEPAESVVRFHHERWDGRGYPSGLAGEEIPQFARIAALADLFDAVTSERHHAPALSQRAGVEAVREAAGGALDPELVELFCDVVVPHPPGSEIALPDGYTGVVASVTDEGPVVRVPGVDVAIAVAA